LSHIYAPPTDLHSLPTRRSSDLHPRARVAPKPGGEDVAAARSRQPYMQALLNLRNYRLPEQKNLRGFGALTPVFSLPAGFVRRLDRKSTRLNSSHQISSYAVFCL